MADRGVSRGVRLGLVLMVGAFAVSTGAAVRAEPSDEPGSARAGANIVEVGPTAANLPLAVRVGQSLAEYEGAGARSQARTVDLGLFGLAMEGKIPGCPEGIPGVDPESLPPTTHADSVDRAHAEDAWPQGPVPVSRQVASASPSGPTSDATTSVAGVRIPGLVEVRAASANAAASFVHGVRQANGVAAVGEIDLLGGAAVLRGLRWTAAHTTSGDDRPERSGRFAIDAIEVAGQEIPVGDDAASLASAADRIEAALSPLGVELVLPRQVVDDTGAVEITPLGIRISGLSLGRDVLGPALGGLNVARPVLEDLLRQLDCRMLLLLLTADVALGIPAGSGSLTLEFGGATASSENQTFENPFAAIALPGFGDPVDEHASPSGTGADSAEASPVPAADQQRSTVAAPESTTRARRIVERPFTVPDVVVIALLLCLSELWVLLGDAVHRYRQRWVISR